MATADEVVLALVSDGERFLLVRSRESGRWLLPGGRVEPGETEPQAVVREVREETGVSCVPLDCLGRRRHPETQRQISYWRCAALATTIAVADEREIAEALWCSAAEGLQRLGHRVFPPVREALLGAGA